MNFDTELRNISEIENFLLICSFVCEFCYTQLFTWSSTQGDFEHGIHNVINNPNKKFYLFLFYCDLYL